MLKRVRIALTALLLLAGGGVKAQGPTPSFSPRLYGR